MARFRLGYFFLLLPLLELEANPSDPTVISGHASCISTPQKLEVNAHDKTIISWKDFSIGSKETTHFKLPDSRSVILNRVGSHNISKIEGLLSSNGIVYLINPNGVLITPTGKIDTAGFLASTLNITDQDFLNGGDILFTGNSGSITNLGAIRCSSGDVILMACQVKNDGTIEAPEGKIALGAAQEILMTLQGEERLTVRLSTSDSKEEIGVHQIGTLEALQAELKADGNLFAYAIKNEGHINATATVHRNGRIYLVAEKGHVTSSGTLTALGGEVRVLGQIASLTEDAQIDVSDNKGGGTVLIGGDFQGKNPDILNAEYTSVDSGVTIKADALIQGNGGKVILWGDKENYFYGNISAQGGPQGGDGGFVEVSGKYLNYQGMTKTYAPRGTTGTLLLDPITVNISNGVDTGTFNACPVGTYNYVSPTTVINIANLITNLGAGGCAVTIDSSAAGAGTGTITLLNTLILPAGSHTLTLTNATVANADILIQAALENDSSGNLICNSGRNITFTSPFGYTQTGSGSATFAANQTTASTGFTMPAGSNLNVSAGTGNVTITGTAITCSGTTTLSSPGFFSATSNAGATAINGSISSTAGGSFTASATGPVTINSTAGTTSSFAAGSVVSISTSGGGATLSNTTGGMTFATGSGSLTVSSAGAININGPLTYASSGACQFTSTASGITSNGSAVMNFNSGSGDISFKASAGSIIFGAAATNSSASPLITASSGGAAFNGTLTNNSTFAGVSLSVTTSNGQIGFGANFSSSSPGTSIFTSTFFGGAAINTSATSTISTTGSGSLVLNGTATLGGQHDFTPNGPINYNSSGPFEVIVHGGGVVAGSGAVITIGNNAGPVSFTAARVGGYNFGAAITNNSANRLTIEGGAGISFNGTLTNNSTFAGTSLYVFTSGGSISFGTGVNFSSSSPGTSSFVCSAASTPISTSLTSTISTTGSGSLILQGTSTVGGQPSIALNGPINYNSSGTFQIFGLGGFSTTGASGAITLGLNAGPAIFTFAGITFGAAITNNSANPLTITSGQHIIFNGLLTNNSTFTGPSLFVNAGSTISFGTTPAGFTSSSNGASVFFANSTFSTTDALSFMTTTPPTTGSAGSLSISAKGGGNAVNILCPITLGTTGAFSATALVGNVAISGSIQSTAGGPFNISALGAAGAITLSSTTAPFINFSTGSAVNLFSRGATTLSATSTTFGAGAGSSLTIGTPAAPVGSIAINSPLSYSSPGLCQFVSIGTFANNGSGTMTFMSGCGDATFESLTSTVTFNTTAQVTFQSGAGNATVTTAAGTGGSITVGPFDFESGSGKAATFNSNSALTIGGNFSYGVTSPGSGTCNMTSVGLLTVGPSTFNLNTSSLNMTSTAGGITTLASGPITVASTAGALTMNAFGTITLGGTITDNSATSPLTMITTSATGDINISNTITTTGNGSVNATAGRSITFPVTIGYTQAFGTGTFIAGKADSAGKFSTSVSSPLATSGSAILSITGANAAGSDAITIAGALSPASSGAFSAIATTGNVTITGAITATGGGDFNASALGPSGSVNLTTAVTNSFTGSAVSLSAGTGGVGLSTTNTTFAAGPGSLTVNSAGTAINTALTYASSGNCQFIATGGNITSSPAGVMNFNSGSGPISFTANTIANQSITFGADIINNSANSLTITSSGTTAFNANANLTNNSTLGTTSLIVNAGRNISFSANHGFTSSSPGASNFTADIAALGSFFTVDATSHITTTAGAGAVSITAANATGATAISILCPINLASPNAFSVTATTGNVVISGAITSSTTTNGAFNISALGESGTITLSGTTSFSPGSAVSLTSAGLTTLSGPTMTFGSVSNATGSLTVNAGSIAIINNTLTYNSPGACQFIASGLLTNSPAGNMTFNNGSGAATFQSTAGAVTFDAAALITFSPGAGSVTVQTTAPAGGAINVGPFTFNSGVAKTAIFNSNTTLTLNGAFNYGGSSATSTMTSAGLLTVGNTLNLTASGALTLTSTGDGLTTTAPINVSMGAGPLTMSALNTLTLGAALADSSATLLTMTASGVLGDVLINAALTTSGSANVTAGRNLTFGAAIPYTQTVGTGTFLAGQAAEGLFSITAALATSGTGNLSITSSNAPASNAITIGALNIAGSAGSGSFLATATEGNVLISGNIASTVSAPFTVSAPGTAGAITLSGTTASFTPGSVVNLGAAGSTALALSGTSTFGNGGSGSLSISGTTAGVTISNPLIYDTTGAFLISSSGSTITTTSTGTITVSAGSGLTMNANGLITLGGAVQYNSSDVGGFAATSTAGGITITAPVTVSTTAPLSLSATTAGQQVLIQNQVTNSSTGNITVTSSNLTLEPVAGSGTSAQLGTLSGLLTLTNVTQVSLIGGTASGAFAQLGYSINSPTSNITFTNCNSLLLQPGTADSCYTLVGHGLPNSAGSTTLVGNITISGTGNLTMGTSGNGTNCFSQIGHVQSLAHNTTATGTVSVNLGGSISLLGGDNLNGYALIGHGGVNTGGGTHSYTGDVTVQAAGNLVLTTHSSGSSAFTAIGPAVISNGTVTITGGHTINATAGGSITLQPASINECVIGAYVRGSGANTINPLTINVSTGQDLIMTGAPNPGISTSGALVGALAYTGAVPFAAAGTSSSTLTVTVGRNLEMQTGAGGANNTTFTAIQNGLTGATALTVNVAGATTVMGGNNLSTITSIGPLTLNVAGDVTLLSNQSSSSALGTASLQGNGDTSVSGNDVTLTGFIGGAQALIQNSTGNLSVISNFMTIASHASIQLTGGSGVFTVNAATGDLNLNSLASIQNSGTGATSMTVGGTASLTAGAGNVTIVNAAGMLMMNITDNLNLITNMGGSASITSNGPITISAQNAALFGLGAGQQSVIKTTAGDLLLMAMNDITLDDNALITNTGVGNLTLVADQQAPLPPQIGPGRFILNPGTNVTSGGGLLRAFAARPNGITEGNLAFGHLNGHPATETVVCPFEQPTPSDQNVYETYYDLFVAGGGVGASLEALGARGNPYSLYYKTAFIPPVPPTPPTPVPQPVLVRDLSKISFASAEVFAFLREYPEYPKYKSDEREFYLKCKICHKRVKRFCMDVDDRYPYMHQNWTLYPIGL